MRDAEWLINDMVFDIAKMRSKYSGPDITGYLALLAFDDETKKYVPLVDCWSYWASYYSVPIPDRAYKSETKMLAPFDSPIWAGLGLRNDGEPFAFAGLLGTRFSLVSVDRVNYSRLFSKEAKRSDVN